MSTDIMEVDTPTPKEQKRSKDTSEKSSSKKRRREEQLQNGVENPTLQEETSTPKPSKKRRKSDKGESNDTNGHRETAANASIPDSTDAGDEQATSRKSKKKRKSDQEGHVAERPETEAIEDSVTVKKEKKRKSEPQGVEETPVERSNSPTLAVLPTPEPDIAGTTATSSMEYLNKGQVERHTPFVSETATLLLPLAPAAFNFPLQGLCAEHLSPLLLTYYPPLDGIVLSYSHPRLSDTPDFNPPYIRRPQHTPPESIAPAESDPDSDADEILSQPSSDTASEHSIDLIIDSAIQRDEETGTTLTRKQKRKTYSGPLVLAKQVDEYNTPLAYLTADFLLLRPERGTWLQGVVQVQNPSWLGLVCWNFFNAGIPRRRLPRGWKWVDAVRVEESTERAGAEAEDMGEEGAGEPAAQEGVVVDASEGFWVDEQGGKVQGTVEFRLVDFESAVNTERDRGFVSITGTLLSEKEDEEVEREEREREKGGRDKGKKTAREE
ncbi:DNA-directed RNA polymerase I subunit rpa43-like protein [Elsinoe fawcettii]|nr:DNA-directed RNA polymerase I subunit rpa43-like protein [Elsinoe fawcettii]